MMQILYRLALPLLGIGLLTSCEDELSQIGESIQSPRDKIESQVHYLQFESSSVQASSIYTGSSIAGLLGVIHDPVYGDFEADFATQVRTARDFQFTQTPKDGVIDSVLLRLVYNDYAGLRSAPLQISVYEMPKGFAGSDYSETSLKEYATASTLLGRASVTLESNSKGLPGASDTTKTRYLSIELNDELGQRIYNLSKSNVAAFYSQETFSNQVLGGLYVTITTGSGTVIYVSNIDLGIYYSYDNSEGKTQVASEHFVNTKLTPHTNAISNTYIDDLLSANADYTYVKGPSGVQTEITLPKAQMERLLAGKEELSVGTGWSLADAPLSLVVDNPENLLLNPPSYMMLMPTDSVASYFRRNMTERTQSSTSYLSSVYVSKSTKYDFHNIARMLTEHLRKHASYDATAKQWTVQEDLKLRVLPVRRYTTTSSSGSTEVTTAIHEYLFPCFVRLSKKSENLKVGVVSAEFK